MISNNVLLQVGSGTGLVTRPDNPLIDAHDPQHDDDNRGHYDAAVAAADDDDDDDPA